jgi:hypothetical protein
MTYDAVTLAKHLAATDVAWGLSLVAAAYQASSRLREPSDVVRSDDPILAELIVETQRALSRLEAREWEDRRDDVGELFQAPVVSRLQFGSPLDILLDLGPLKLFVGGAAGATGWVALKLFVKMLRQPEEIGAWLPSIAAGWHRKQQERLLAKQERRVVEVRGQLLEAELALIVQQSIDNGGPLLTPEVVTIEGVEEPPDDILD